MLSVGVLNLTDNIKLVIASRAKMYVYAAIMPLFEPLLRKVYQRKFKTKENNNSNCPVAVPVRAALNVFKFPIKLPKK